MMSNKDTNSPLPVIYIYIYLKLIYTLRLMKHMQSIMPSLLGFELDDNDVKN